ncbi:uncharacterized protein LOC108673648 [Hyalella azteca]|uniref:Uncharacterized protein LOC108673648 n=1 Tax=Hyalella azteca TaxID=294128 RepID=A0A8B7NVN7_HYAAZ|nr:uncharacterized protein LOC108673648 [Hyalella azteca]
MPHMGLCCHRSADKENLRPGHRWPDSAKLPLRRPNSADLHRDSADYRSDFADYHRDSADYHRDSADYRSDFADYHRNSADYRSGRADCRSDSADCRRVNAHYHYDSTDFRRNSVDSHRVAVVYRRDSTNCHCVSADGDDMEPIASCRRCVPPSTFLQVSSILGSRKNSRGSSSGRSSLASVMSVKSADNFPRGSSLTVEGVSAVTSLRPRRAVSLKLPSKHRKGQDEESRLPTIYVQDPPTRRKTSLQRALSLLSVGGSANNASVPPKPVRKILRQPTRRRHVQGFSGLPIADQNRAPLSRSSPLYYPTPAPPRTRRVSDFN